MVCQSRLQGNIFHTKFLSKRTRSLQITFRFGTLEILLRTEIHKHWEKKSGNVRTFPSKFELSLTSQQESKDCAYPGSRKSAVPNVNTKYLIPERGVGFLSP